MKIKSGLDNQLHERKLHIVKIIYSSLLLLGILGSLCNIYLYISYQGDAPSLAPLFLTIATTILFAYIRFSYIYVNMLRSFNVALVFLGANGLLAILLEGANTSFLYVIFTIVILSTSIIVSVNRAVLYTILGFIVTMGVAALQQNGTLAYQKPGEGTEFISVIMTTATMGVITYITKAGYSQIEHSYEQAYKHAKKLERLNEDLEKIIKRRTQQLEESFSRQTESMHAAAVMGSVTESILHDIATPLSALRGTFPLVKDISHKPEDREILLRGEKALMQVNSIIESGKEIMYRDPKKIIFSPAESIQSVIYVIQNILRKENIELKVDVEPGIKIEGSKPMFMRIVTNLLQNAIEELAQIDKRKKRITLEGRSSNDLFYLKIKDNGRGIKVVDSDKIFSAEFSLKGGDNFGFGLPFVKNAMERYFDGDISVNSEVGKYTEFELVFDSKKNANDS